MSIVRISRVYMYRQAPDMIGALAWSPDGKYLVSSSNRVVYGSNREQVTLHADVQVWNALTGEMASAYKEHSQAVIAVAWSPDGTRIASGGYDHTVQIWEASTGRHLLTYAGHSNVVCTVAWSPDGTYIVSGESGLTPIKRDKHVIQQIWEAETGRTIVRYTGHADTVYAVAWSPDGTRIASGGYDHTVQIWEASTGRHLLTYAGHTESVYELAWSPDGTCIASASQDHTTQVWKALTGEHSYTYYSENRAMLSVAWSPDGRYLATISKVGQLWDAATGDLLFTFGATNAGMDKITWAPDGKHFAFRQETRVQVWQVEYTE